MATRIPTYDASGNLPDQGANVRADPNQLGMVGAELAGMGREIAALAGHYARKIQHGEDLNFVANIVPKAETEWNEFLIQSQQSAAPGAKGFTDAARSWFEKKRQEWTKAAPSDEARQSALTHLAELQQRATSQALTFENKQRFKYFSDGLDQSFREVNLQAYRNPPERDRYAKFIESAVNEASLPGVGWLNRDEAHRIAEDARLRLYTSAFMGTLDADPLRADAELKSGQWDQFLDVDTLLKLKDKTLSRVEHLKSLARADLPDRMRANIESIRQTGIAVPGVAQRVYSEANPKAAGEHLADMERAGQFYSFKQRVMFLPEADAWKELEQHKPKPGAPSFDQDMKLYHELGMHLAERKKILFGGENGKSADPAEYVIMNSPAIKAKIEKQRDVTAFDLIPDVILEQKALGLQDRQIHALSNQTASTFVAEFNNAPAEQRPQRLAQVKDKSGEHFNIVFRDLVNAGLSAENHLLLSLGDHQAAPTLVPIISEAIQTGSAELRKGIPPADLKTVSETVASELAEWTQCIMKSDISGARTKFVNDVREKVIDSALVYNRKGISAGEAAKRAAKEFILDRYHDINKTYPVPRQFDPDRIEGFLRQVLNGIDKSQFDFDIPLSANDRRNAKPEQLKTDYFGALRRGGAWVINEDESGVYLLDPVGNPAHDKNGKLFEVKFSDMMQWKPEPVTDFGPYGLGGLNP